MVRPLKISAIIVAFNEELLIDRIIGDLKTQNYDGEDEIILADGGSTDRSILLARKQQVKIVVSTKKGKSFQMNAAAAEATGDILFFVHADMTLPGSIFSAIAEHIESGYSGGGFSNEFDLNNKKIKKLGIWMNFRFFDKREQSDKGIFYGDNGIFILRDVFEKLGGFKEIPIMEDYEFSKRLSKDYKTIKVKEPRIIVSARRHLKSGFLKTRFQWVAIRNLYKFGISPYLLTKWYKEVR